MWIVLALLILWATAAIYIDFRIAALRIPLTLIYLFGIIAIFIKFRWSRWAAILCLLSFVLRAPMVAHSQAHEQWRLATRRGSNSLG